MELAARARPCAACTCLFGLINTPHGALRAPPPALLLIQPSKIKKISRTWAARVKGFPEIKCFPSGSNLDLPRQGLYSFWTTEALKYEVSCPPPRPSQLRWFFPAIFWGQNYVPVRLFIHIFLSFSSLSYYLFLFFFSYICIESVCCITGMHINYINIF